jgi:hypothetical protein
MHQFFAWWTFCKTNDTFRFESQIKYGLTNYVSRVLLKKLSQLVNKFCTLYRTQDQLIIFSAKASHLSLLWCTLIQFTLSHSLSLASVLIQYYHPVYPWYFQSVSFPQAFAPKLFTRLSPICTFYARITLHLLRFDHPNILWRVQIIKFLIMQAFQSPVTSFF